MHNLPSCPLSSSPHLQLRAENPLVSIVVPVYNEQDAIELFLETTCAELESHNLQFEIVFVNDGSQDGTIDRLWQFAESDKRIKFLCLSRNFGKEAALSAGIDYAVGDVLILIDVDLQDPPQLIPRFIQFWREGYEIVYGVRISRKHDEYSKRTSAAWFYRIFNRLSRVQIPENAGDFRLIDRRVADVLRQMPERNRFMKGMYSWVGFRSTEVPFERPPRAVGKTKWNHWGLWNFALDGLVSFSTLPLRVWSYIGGAIAALSFIYGAFIVIRTLLLGIDMPGYASLMTTVLFLGGIQLFSIGVIGEYLGRIFIEVKDRPLYIVETTYPPAQPSPIRDTFKS